MRLQNDIGVRLLLAVCLAAVVSVPAGSMPTEAADVDGGAQTAKEAATDRDSQVVVYYFHGTRRCKTCRTIEAYAEEVVKSRFAKDLESGALAWKVVNYDEPENEHFIKEFSLVSASLVLVEINDEGPVRFEVLQKAWSLVRDESSFDQYVRQSIRDYIG